MSKVKALIEETLKMAAWDQALPPKDQRVTVRLRSIDYGALLLLSKRFQDTPTGVAQNLIVAALKDALEAIGYESFDAALPDIIKELDAS